MIFKNLNPLYEIVDNNDIQKAIKLIKSPPKFTPVKTKKRSVLMVSGHQVKHLNKIDELKADVIMLNLEDGVPKDKKEIARILIAVFLSNLKNIDKEIVIRINALDEGGFEDIEFLDKLGLEIFKIPSGEITNLPYLRKIGLLKKKVILSTGMSDLGEIEDAIDVLVKADTKKENITVLHANTEYPTPFEDVNLKAMQTIACAFGVKVGYSDHTLGIEVPIAAVAMGASVIEKHFTLDRNLPGPDHKASLEPNELKAMVEAIRNIEKALGDGIKKPSKSESKNIEIARKSIVAKRDIKRGEKFTEENLTVKRPGNGISPMRWDEIIGKTAVKNYKKDEQIRL